MNYFLAQAVLQLYYFDQCWEFTFYHSYAPVAWSQFKAQNVCPCLENNLKEPIGLIFRSIKLPPLFTCNCVQSNQESEVWITIII